MKSRDVVAPDGTKLKLFMSPQNSEEKEFSLLFMHGFCQSSLVWQKQLLSADLSKYNLFAFDLRGHGASDKPSDPRKYFSQETWANDVKAIVDSLKPYRLVLCGWSYGARIAAEYLSEFGGENIAHLYLVSGLPGQEAISKIWQSIAQGLVDPILETQIQAAELFVGALCHERLCENDKNLFLTGIQATPKYVREALFNRQGFVGDMAWSRKIPITIIHGENDCIVLKENLEIAAQLFPKSKRILMPRVGHCPFWEEELNFNKLIGGPIQ
jgi:pimeloyl-ACP methyl ester carboxylesterase